MKRFLSLILALILCLSMMPAALAEAPLEGEITFWHSFTQGPRMERIQAAADSFMAANPGVKINIETFSWADFYTKWTTGLASGNVPDMSTAQNAQVVEMLDADAIIPLNDLVDSIGRDRFFEAPLQEMTVDGNIYSVPIYLHAYVMWYRHDLLDKYNLEVPTTWAELYEAASIIQQGEGGEVAGCSVPMGTNDQCATVWLDLWAGSAGKSLLTEDGKANLMDPTILEGIEYWVKMYKENSPADSINYNTLDQATLYYLGKSAFDFNSGFHIGGVETNSPQLLDRYYRLKADERIAFAGQMTGVEGYVESAASGFLVGVELARRLRGMEPVNFPAETAIGALGLYVSNQSIVNFQPMNINFGIMPQLGYRVKGKRNKNAELSRRSLAIVETLKEEVLA